MKRGWICDGCGKGSVTAPWNCPGCEKEICDHCFCLLGHCKSCCKGQTERAVAEAANRAGFDFATDDYSMEVIID